MVYDEIFEYLNDGNSILYVTYGLTMPSEIGSDICDEIKRRGFLYCLLNPHYISVFNKDKSHKGYIHIINFDDILFLSISKNSYDVVIESDPMKHQRLKMNQLDKWIRKANK